MIARSIGAADTEVDPYDRILSPGVYPDFVKLAHITLVRYDAGAHMGTGVVLNRQLDGATIIASCTGGPCGLA